MKLNWAERWAVNNPLRVLEQAIEIRRLKRMLTLPKRGFTAMEIGCGRGAGAHVILKEFQPSRIHAMDVDMEMIGKAKRYLSDAEKRKISLFAGDASALPVKTQSMDVVFGFGVLHHVQDWRAALTEIARVLKPGGSISSKSSTLPSTRTSLRSTFFSIQPRTVSPETSSGRPSPPPIFLSGIASNGKGLASSLQP